MTNPYQQIPSTPPSAAPPFSFSTQPRYIQFLVFVTFPFYGSYRVGKRIIYEVGKKVVDTAEHVVKTCRTVYKVCYNLYSIVAPKVWNGLIYPLIIHPVTRFIVHPIIMGVQMIYDCMASVVVMTYNATCAVFTAIGDTWNSLFQG
jgi:hypothetical protein